ncbi:MAG TPA: hypothetical protein PKK31_11765, partial [Elusimicrobiales bacterium]|nr:hypothetical protein [Elusimicrobiales bacterium]
MAVIVYSPGYSAPLPGHVFRPDKFRLAFDALLRDGVVSRADVAAPAKLSKKDLLLAHTPGWTRKCLSGR